jgi:large subunit ribosomal protein L31
MLTAVKLAANRLQQLRSLGILMKKDLHPTNYRPVVFQDLNDNTTFLTKSTVATDDTIKLGGVEYPLVKVHISSASHPFYTGQEKLLDIEGRVDKFKARQEAAQKRAEAMKAKAQKTRTKSPKADETQKIGTLKRKDSK